MVAFLMGTCWMPSLTSTENWRNVRRRRAFLTRRPRTTMSADGGFPSGSGAPLDEGKAICLGLELAYREAWVMVGMKGVSPEYEAALKKFIQATMAAYAKGYSIEALNFEMQMNRLESGNPEIDKLLKLTKAEAEVRTIWMILIYLTLDFIGFRLGEPRPPKPEDPYQLTDLVRAVTDAYKRGHTTLESYKMELSFQSISSSSNPDEPPQQDPTKPQETPGAATIRSQWMRLVFLTNQLATKNP